MSESAKINDGGPAFPTMTDDVLVDAKAGRVLPVYRGGMSLRDYFAAKAMQGLLASDLRMNRDHEDVALWAYTQADSMLRARSEASTGGTT